MDATKQAVNRSTAKRIDHLARENEQLKIENSALHKEFKDFGSLQEQLVKALHDRPTVEIRKRRLGLLRMALLLAGGVVIGMRLGRERYEQMLSAVKERMRGGKDEPIVTVPDAAEEVQASNGIEFPAEMSQ